jgi:tRNA threonylcarbamoyladenosine biosynthesis protein TsaB
MARGHAEALMPQIARVMDAAQCEFADLGRIAVTVGPGSFTGLRVGISAARGLALAAGKPAIGLSTLSALAAPHVAARTQDTIIAAIDARNDQVYFQIFAANGTTMVPPRLDLAANVVRATVMEPTLITGSGAALVAAHWPDSAPPPRVDARPAADIGWVARLGAAAADERSAPAPLYLRRPDARAQDGARLPRR